MTILISMDGSTNRPGHYILLASIARLVVGDAPKMFFVVPLSWFLSPFYTIGYDMEYNSGLPLH